MGQEEVCNAHMANTECQVGGRFRRCRATPSHVCQYCARDFCDHHSYHVKGYEAVCTRKRCALKHDDLQRHMEYKAEVQGRNKSGQCGEPGCESLHPPGQCSLCRGFFCNAHLQDRSYPMHDGWVKVDKHVSICAWCWDRRKIWQRR